MQVSSGSGDMRRALESCARAFAALCQDAASAKAEAATVVDTAGVLLPSDHTVHCGLR